jgi:hypothetical protein
MNFLGYVNASMRSYPCELLSVGVNISNYAPKH